MLRSLLLLLILAAPTALAACGYGERPVRVPVESQPGVYKNCPRGQTDC